MNPIHSSLFVNNARLSFQFSAELVYFIVTEYLESTRISWLRIGYIIWPDRNMNRYVFRSVGMGTLNAFDQHKTPLRITFCIPYFTHLAFRPLDKRPLPAMNRKAINIYIESNTRTEHRSLSEIPARIFDYVHTNSSFTPERCCWPKNLSIWKIYILTHPEKHSYRHCCQQIKYLPNIFFFLCSFVVASKQNKSKAKKSLMKNFPMNFTRPPIGEKECLFLNRCLLCAYVFFLLLLSMPVYMMRSDGYGTWHREYRISLFTQYKQPSEGHISHTNTRF